MTQTKENNNKRNNQRNVGVIFDMDGVIFDSESIWLEAFLNANIKFNANFTEKDRQNCCGKDENLIRKELKEINSELDVDAYRNYILSYVVDAINKGKVELKLGFLDLISYLKNCNYKIALATSSHKQRADILFEKRGLNIYDIFDAAVFAEDVETAKPDPTLFLLAAKKISILPENCIVIEDSLNGIEASKAGKMKAIMVIDIIQPTSESLDYCILTAKNLNEVTEFLKSSGRENENN